MLKDIVKRLFPERYWLRGRAQHAETLRIVFRKIVKREGNSFIGFLFVNTLRDYFGIFILFVGDDDQGLAAVGIVGFWHFTVKYKVIPQVIGKITLIDQSIKIINLKKWLVASCQVGYS